MWVSLVVSRLEGQSIIWRARYPTVGFVLDPKRFAHNFKTFEKVRKTLLAINSAPWPQHCVLPHRRGHDQNASWFQNLAEQAHHFEIAIGVVGFDSIAARNTNMLDGRTIDHEIEAIHAKGRFQKIGRRNSRPPDVPR